MADQVNWMAAVVFYAIYLWLYGLAASLLRTLHITSAPGPDDFTFPARKASESQTA